MGRANTTCGIYKITNLVNNKMYIGSSKSIESRLYCHKWELNRQEHHSQTLQRSVNKHGIDNFSFETILICNENMLLDYEQIIIDYYQSANSDNGYNICSIAGRSYGSKRTELEKLKMSEIRKGKQIYKNNPERYKALMKRAELRRGENHHFYGKPMTAERKDKMRQSKIGKTAWNKGLPSKAKGIKRPQEVIDKIRATKNKNKSAMYYFKDSDFEMVANLRFNQNLTYAQIGEKLNCNRQTVSKFIKDKLNVSS